MIWRRQVAMGSRTHATGAQRRTTSSEGSVGETTKTIHWRAWRWMPEMRPLIREGLSQGSWSRTDRPT